MESAVHPRLRLLGGALLLAASFLAALLATFVAVAFVVYECREGLHVNCLNGHPAAIMWWQLGLAFVAFGGACAVIVLFAVHRRRAALMASSATVLLYALWGIVNDAAVHAREGPHVSLHWAFVAAVVAALCAAAAYQRR